MARSGFCGRPSAWETEQRRLDVHRLNSGVQGVLGNAHRGFYVVAESQALKTVVGQLLITFEWSDWRNGVMWWVQSAYVRDDCRRQGVFRMLYHHVLKQAEQEILNTAAQVGPERFSILFKDHPFRSAVNALLNE